MPKLPDYTALGERPVPNASGGVASYSPVENTGVARGMIGAGQDIQEAVSIITATNDRQDRMVAEAALNSLQAKRLELELGESGFQTVRGAGAVGPKFVESYSQKFSDTSAEILRNLQNDNQKRLFQQREPLAKLQYRSALLKHQAVETDRFNEQTENDSIELARRQIFTAPNDPQAVDAGLSQIGWAIDQKAKRMGWDGVVVTETKRKFTEKVMEDVASMLVERDPVNSLAAINKRMGVGAEMGPSGVTAIDALDVPKLVTLRHRASSYVTQAENKLRIEAEKRLKEAESEIKDLQSFVLTGQMVSPEYERTVLAKVQGTPFEQSARVMIGASYEGAAHGSLPLPKQDERLRMLSATMAVAGSNPADLKIANDARQITNTQRAAYKENPWAAAARFGRQQSVPEMAIGAPEQVPQLIAQRLPLMTSVEMFAGEPVSPLQPGEAKAFSEKLKTLPPDAKAEVLAQTGVMLSAPRAAALAEQIDKNDKPTALALLMGLDRTTAGRAASTYVLRGAQALQDKTVKKDDQALAGWRAEIATLVRGTLGDDRAESQIIDASYYVRAALDQEGIAAVGFKPMKASAENAIAMVIGRPLERGGVKTFMPRGMDERTFDERLKAYTPERLRQIAPAGVVFVRGAPVKVEQLAPRLDEYGLKRDGAGRYIPVVRNAPVTLDPQGQQLLRLEVR
jgi:hypothetical protein